MIVTTEELTAKFINQKASLIEGVREEYTRDKAENYRKLVKEYIDKIQEVETEIYSIIKEDVAEELEVNLMEAYYRVTVLEECLTYEQVNENEEMNLINEVEIYINSTISELNRIQTAVKNLITTLNIQTV